MTCCEYLLSWAAAQKLHLLGNSGVIDREFIYTVIHFRIFLNHSIYGSTMTRSIITGLQSSAKFQDLIIIYLVELDHACLGLSVRLDWKHRSLFDLI